MVSTISRDCPSRPAGTPETMVSLSPGWPSYSCSINRARVPGGGPRPSGGGPRCALGHAPRQPARHRRRGAGRLGRRVHGSGDQSGSRFTLPSRLDVGAGVRGVARPGLPDRVCRLPPASGWEKGQVVNQVGLVRERFFTPHLAAARIRRHAKALTHPPFGIGIALQQRLETTGLVTVRGTWEVRAWSR